MIKVGDCVPQGEFFVKTDDGMSKRTTAEIFNGRKVAAFAIPGAFTGTCQNQHLPGFRDNLDAFKAKGVDEIVCIAVNDPFVLAAWSDVTDAKGKVTLLSDGNGVFTRAAGMEMDLSGGGLGERSKRYAMLVDDGVVKALHVEPSPGEAKESSAETLLGDL